MQLPYYKKVFALMVKVYKRQLSIGPQDEPSVRDSPREHQAQWITFEFGGLNGWSRPFSLGAPSLSFAKRLVSCSAQGSAQGPWAMDPG